MLPVLWPKQMINDKSTLHELASFFGSLPRGDGKM
jgi:hypothetical protein